MQVIQGKGLANLANLRDELRRAEKAASPLYLENFGLMQARETVLTTVEHYRNNRYRLGQALWTYRLHFKQDQLWTAAAKVIGAAIGHSERSVHRIISDYKRAANLPMSTLDAMMEQEIDPAAGKNAELVENLRQMPEPATHEEAVTAVTEAHKQHVTRKKQEKRIRSNASRPTLDEFSKRIVRQFEARYRSAPSDVRDREVRYVLERVVNTLRADVEQLRRFGRPALVPKPETKEAA